MDRAELRRLLDRVAAGEINPDSALSALAEATLELPTALLDRFRDLRCGLPEAVYAPGKTQAEVMGIVDELHRDRGSVLVTRADEELLTVLAARFPGGERHDRAGLFRLWGPVRPEAEGLVGVLAAGTSDLGVAEEAARTAEAAGARVELVADVGVAALQRVLGQAELIRRARVLVVVAGMDGALPSVVAGLSPSVVVAVPTSRGYGASLRGIAPLLTMLNACAPGVVTVNIDNGYGAGCAAALINRRREVDGDEPTGARA